MGAQKKKEEYLFSEVIDVDGKQSEMTCKVVFDVVKGTSQIIPKLTTKQLTFNKQTAKAVRKRIFGMLEEAYDLALELTEEWVKGQRPGVDINQRNIFDVLKEKGDEGDEDGECDED